MCQNNRKAATAVVYRQFIYLNIHKHLSAGIHASLCNGAEHLSSKRLPCFVVFFSASASAPAPLAPAAVEPSKGVQQLEWRRQAVRAGRLPLSCVCHVVISKRVNLCSRSPLASQPTLCCCTSSSLCVVIYYLILLSARLRLLTCRPSPSNRL